MNDDTTNKAVNETSDAATTRAAAKDQDDAARRTPAALLARSLQARFAAVARQSVALGLFRAGAEEFTHVSTADYCDDFPEDGFPEGSYYGALFPQDDLSPAQALAIFQAAGQAVQAEAKHMTAGTNRETAAVITGDFIAAQLAEWEEAAALDWVRLCEMRERMLREDDAVDARKAAEETAQQADPEATTEAAPAPRLYLGQPLTPGMEYVADWLGGIPDTSFNEPFDAEWVAQNIDKGFFCACPRCHVLHLPRLAWDLGIQPPNAVPADACDVCALLPSAAQLPFRADGLRAALAGAPAALAEARQDRARLLFELWIGASLAADQWVLAEMEGALRRVEETVKEAMPLAV